MLTKATISLDDKVKKAGQDKARELNIRGGFSGYIEMLIQADVDGKKPYFAKKGESK